MLNRLNYADAVAGDDGDMLPFGAKIIIRGIGCREDREDRMRVYNIPKILRMMGLSYETLIEICLLYVLTM